MKKKIAFERYGGFDESQTRIFPSPEKSNGRELLFHHREVNPIDFKIRKGVYDDNLEYYQKVTGLIRPYHCIGIDGASIVFEFGPDVKNFKPGGELTVGHEPKTVDFVESAALPLTYGTAYETLAERMGIPKGENAGLLIINSAGRVGSVASQIARSVLELTAIITTASRPETIAFAKAKDMIHVINYKKDLDIPIN